MTSLSEETVKRVLFSLNEIQYNAERMESEVVDECEPCWQYRYDLLKKHLEDIGGWLGT